MTVNALLNNKPAKTITLPSSSTLTDICNTLAKNRIGTILIVDDGKLCGIVSERDVVRLLASSGDKALNSTASDCMTRKLVTCTRTDTVSMVMERMTTGRFRHIPIVIAGNSFNRRCRKISHGGSGTRSSGNSGLYSHYLNNKFCRILFIRSIKNYCQFETTSLNFGCQPIKFSKTTGNT